MAVAAMAMAVFAAAHAAEPPADERFAARLEEVRKMAPPGFTVLAQPPFVVAGDEAPDLVRRRATGTVKWAVDNLKQDFFARDPEEVIAIWLFKDTTSYERHARLLFHDEPTTPFGYYSAAHRALVMNIATGGGTLVHEIVHPYMRANFPACPAWFNEGLASLYEQSEERDGHIRGLPNWRLPALQKSIQSGRILSFEKLTGMSDTDFYGGADSPNYSQHYAQARYLCYVLQERGLLVRYFKEFSAHAKDDPTGYASLQKVLGTNDLTAFTKEWSEAVLSLRF
jgi:hypothetical protein